jgi:hypothetical protein
MVLRPEPLLSFPGTLVFTITVFDDNSVANLTISVLLDEQARIAECTRS